MDFGLITSNHITKEVSIFIDNKRMRLIRIQKCTRISHCMPVTEQFKQSIQHTEGVAQFIALTVINII